MIRTGIIGLLFVFMGLMVSAQKVSEKKSITIIKTSAQCEMCEETILPELNAHKGVKEAKMNLETQELTIRYNGIKVTEEELKEVISELGYSAGDLHADEDAYEQLPSCCKKPIDR